MKTALVIIAPQGYQDVELDGTMKGLRNAGYVVTIASTEPGRCTGKLGGAQDAALAMRDVHVEGFDRFAFIGGPGAGVLAENPDALDLVKRIAASGRVCGAICIAPLILASAGVLKGRRATVWDSGGEQAQLLRQYGALYTGEPVTVDGPFVTANGPKAVEEFGRTLANV